VIDWNSITYLLSFLKKFIEIIIKGDWSLCKILYETAVHVDEDKQINIHLPKTERRWEEECY